MTQTPTDSYSLNMPPVSTVRIDGPALRDLRTRRGVTISQLAARTGRHPKAIGRLECGKGKRASEVFANQLANALGASISEFTFDEGAEEAPPEPEEVAA